MPLFVVCAIVPATWVPWPNTSFGWRSLPDEVPGLHEGRAAQIRCPPEAAVALVGHAAVEHGHHRAASRPARRGCCASVHASGTLIPLAPKKFHWRRKPGSFGHAGRVRAPVRHRVGHVRVLAELGDRLAHRVAVVDRELLGAARQRLDGLCARLGRHPGGHAAARALRRSGRSPRRARSQPRAQRRERAAAAPRAARRRGRRIGIGLRWASSVRTQEQIAHAEVVTVCVTGATGFIGAHVARLASKSAARASHLPGRGAPDTPWRHRGRARSAPTCSTARRCDAPSAGCEHGVPLRRLRRLAPGRASLGDERAGAAASPWRRPRPRTCGAWWSPRAWRASARPRPARSAPRTTSTAAAGSGSPIRTPSTRARRRRSRPARATGVEVVIVNPSYVFGVPVDRSAPGRDLHAHDRQLPARAAAGGRGRGDERRRRARRGEGSPARRRARHARRALRARRPRHRAGSSCSSAWRELSGVRHPLLVLPTEAGALARAARGRRTAEPDLRGGARADGAELALLVAQGAARARLPRARPRPHAHRHDRLVPRADRQRCARRRPAVGALAGRHGHAAGGSHGRARHRCGPPSATWAGGWWPP